jgi:4-amino-4-deoxy-L-arabinose transferase-like glycosyltransferase
MRADSEWKDADTPWPGLITFVLSAMLFSAYLCGLFPDVMETDAAQYASISAEMARTGEYLQVKHRHENYLDKPPLLFWLSSVSIDILGNKAWAYKLPSLLLPKSSVEGFVYSRVLSGLVFV